jgi:pimeloyl-ACP methyl ester carboxylesterase
MRTFLRRTTRALLTLVAIAVAILIGFRIAAYARERCDAEAQAPSTGRYVQATDVRVFLQERGPASGPLVLFVHGTGAWSEAWLASLDRLGTQGYHAVAIDLPPFGYSDRPAAPAYDKRTQGERIAAVLAALGTSPAIVVGHSFGAGPAVEAAFAAPQRVRGLVLVDPALSIDADGGPAVGASRPVPALPNIVLSVGPVRDAIVATFLTNPMMTRRLLQEFIDDPARATDAWVEVYRRPQNVTGTTPAVGAWLPQLVAARRVEKSEVPASYAALDMPVEAIWGELDRITPIAQGERLVKLAPRARLTRLPGVGHIPQIEDTARFNDALSVAVDRIKNGN